MFYVDMRVRLLRFLVCTGSGRTRTEITAGTPRGRRRISQRYRPSKTYPAAPRRRHSRPIDYRSSSAPCPRGSCRTTSTSRMPSPRTATSRRPSRPSARLWEAWEILGSTSVSSEAWPASSGWATLAARDSISANSEGSVRWVARRAIRVGIDPKRRVQ